MGSSQPHRTRINNEEVPAWTRGRAIDGYIEHPERGLIMHPSFFDDEGALCEADIRCTCSFRNCFETRVVMAVRSKVHHKISYREAELVWDVSRSTIQRRHMNMERRGKSDIVFLLVQLPKADRRGKRGGGGGGGGGAGGGGRGGGRGGRTFERVGQ